MDALEKLRKPTKEKNYVRMIGLCLLFGVILIAFVFIGPSGMLGGSSPLITVAAKIGSQNISISQYQNQKRLVQQRFLAQFGGNSELLSQDYFKNLVERQSIESLLSREIVYQSFEAEGISVPKAEAAKFIANDIGAFKEDGVFKKSLFNNYLEQTGQSPASFSREISSILLEDRVRNLFLLASLSSEVEQNALAKIPDTKIRFSYAVLDKPTVAKQIQITDVAKSGLVEDPKGLEELEAYYRSIQSEFRTPENVSFRQILIKGQSDISKQKAQGLIKEIKSGVDFGKLATEKSQDILTAARGGLVEKITRTELADNLSDAIFGAQLEEVSEPILVDEGYVIFKKLAHKQASVEDFDSVKEQVAIKFLENKGYESFLSDFDSNFEEAERKFNSLKFKWVDVEPFSTATEQVKNLGSIAAIYPSLLSSVESGKISKLVRLNGKNLIIKNIALEKTDKIDEGPSSQFFSASTRQSINFKSWYEKAQKEIGVQVNPNLSQ